MRVFVFLQEGARTVQGTVRWVSDACGMWCRGFSERGGGVLLEVFNVSANWGKVCADNGRDMCQCVLACRSIFWRHGQVFNIC